MKASSLKPERLFLCVALFFGPLFLLIYPPVQAPDENTHFYRAYQISEGQFVSDRRGDLVGGDMPVSLFKTIQSFERIYTHTAQKTSFEEIYSFFQIPLNPGERLPIAFRNTALFSPVPYLPQALGIWFGKLHGLPPMALMYCGRVFALIAWIFLMYQAIRTIPILKWPLMVLALTPMSLSEAASLAADGFTNGLSFLFISLCLAASLEAGAKLTARRMGLFLLLAALITLSKQIYVLLAALLLIIPADRFGSKKKQMAFLIIAAAICLGLGALWGSVVKGLYFPFFEGISPQEQISYLLQHPFRFPLIIFNTLRGSGANFLEEFIGKFGWLDTSIPKAVWKGYWISLIFLALFAGRRDLALEKKSRWIIAGVFFSGFLAICLALYLHWSYVGSEGIGGIQGRYFIPFSPLLILCLYNKRLAEIVPDYALGILSVATPGLALASSLAAMLHRYYH